MKKWNFVRELVGLAEIYYSHFLLLHDSYNAILHRCWWILRRFGVEIASAALDAIMYSPTVEDCVGRGELPAVRKGVVEGERVTGLPERDLASEAARVRERAESHLESALSRSWSEPIRSEAIAYAMFCAECFAVKEWKFLLHKAIYTRLGAVMSQCVDAWPAGSRRPRLAVEAMVADKDAAEVLKWLGPQRQLD